jgi:deoxyribodipyrimidine photo-lyase
VQTGSGTPFRVYSPFWRAVLKLPEPAAPLAAPEILVPAAGQPRSDSLESWELTPTQPDWAGGLAERWSPGEHEALQRLDEFLEDRVDEYQARRNLPAVEATSELSPHLKWGEISPRTVWHRAIASGRDTAVFLSELGWREFAWHTRYHFGDLETTNLDARFDFFPWRDIDAEELEAWQQGHTGIPLVDGGMRELWQSGFMHNRVRMVVASFLTKHLLFDWRLGEAWFWDTLVDADAASNPFNWQWVAGCGLDASPYFRVFNPALQQQKFDPELQYIHHWAPDALLVPPMIELSLGRNRALAAFEEMKAIVPERR